MASPSSQAPRQRPGLLGFDGEDNEIADFVDDRAEALAARALGGLAQFLSALAGAAALGEEGPDAPRLPPVRRFAGGAANHLVQRPRTDTSRNHLLVPHPRPREIGRLRRGGDGGDGRLWRCDWRGWRLPSGR